MAVASCGSPPSSRVSHLTLRGGGDANANASDPPAAPVPRQASPNYFSAVPRSDDPLVCSCICARRGALILMRDSTLLANASRLGFAFHCAVPLTRPQSYHSNLCVRCDPRRRAWRANPHVRFEPQHRSTSYDCVCECLPCIVGRSAHGKHPDLYSSTNLTLYDGDISHSRQLDDSSRGMDSVG